MIQPSTEAVDKVIGIFVAAVEMSFQQVANMPVAVDDFETLERKPL